ncbi:YlcI/YnfO family protein [Mycobacterium sp.]|uniref:YlcI/YnfO family protein n=1 Tax=Mycobacterium sp. TaxID=1785 RepID=UPI0031DB01EC
MNDVSTQIAVRLPDEIVAFIDAEVRGHHARSRAAVVLRALERERRRRLAERDAEILAASMSAPSDVDALAGHSARTALDID